MPAEADLVNDEVAVKSVSISYYVTDEGLLINLKTDHPKRHLINGLPLAPTFNPRWWLIEGQATLTSYSEHAGTRSINQRYVLINDVVHGPPQTIPASDIEKDCNYEWTGKYAGLQSLYRYESDQEDFGFVKKPFAPRKLGELKMSNLGDPTLFSYKLLATGFMSSRTAYADTISYKDVLQEYDWANNRIEVDEISKAMNPDIAWHLHPCSISSEIAYRIIRAWVKDHIDPLYAVVTSDYDFCFTVQKKIRVVPFTKKVEQLTNRWKSYSPPRFTSSTVDYEKRVLFEMTDNKNRYQGYSVMTGFSAKSLAELAEQIDHYLRDLMEVINAPLTRCQHCEGLGVVDYRKLPTNERDALKMKSDQP